MKAFKIALIALTLVLLSACEDSKTDAETPPAEVIVTAGIETVTPEAPDEQEIIFTRDSFPRMDGSTSMVPLAQAVAAVLLGEDRDAVEPMISFNRTSQSFRNLMYGTADILITAEPALSVLEELEENGFEYEMAHIATDALIFVVNADNPVDSLTAEQIQGIYSGGITNWKEVGGDDLEIIPFQRNSEAGSQAAMLRLVMKDIPMIEPPTEYIVESMSGLMEAVRSFDGSPGALGYSVYYYANDMRMAEGLKIIAVDGVEPGAESIRSGEYPFLALSHTVIAASSGEGSPERIIFNWLQGEDGQRLVSSQGYVSVMDIGG